MDSNNPIDPDGPGVNGYPWTVIDIDERNSNSDGDVDNAGSVIEILRTDGRSVEDLFREGH